MKVISQSCHLIPDGHPDEGVHIENEGNYFSISTIGKSASVTFHVDELEAFIKELRKTVKGKSS